MNNKKVTKCKGSKSKRNNDSAEVFVLPPNLLEKLGIKLGNKGTTPECTEYLVSDKNSISKEIDVDPEKHILNNASENYLQNESSIIETAKLMKNSVFLSPTFISNNTCTIQGEVEIVGNSDLVKVSSDTKISKLDAFQSNEYDVSELKTREDVSLTIQQESVPLADFKNTSSALTSVRIQDTNKDDLSTNVDVEIRNVANKNIFNEYAHDEYPFDCSNIGLNDKDDELNNLNSLPECENNPSKSKKIKIISEEILDSSQLQVYQKCYSPNFNSLIPVTMNTVVKSHYQNSIYYQNSNDMDCSPTLITDSIHLLKSGVKDLSDVNKPNYVKESLRTHEGIPKRSDSESCNILSNASDETLIAVQEQEGLNSDNKISQVSTGVIKEHVNEVDTDVVLSCKVDSVVERNVDTKDTLGKINLVVAQSKNKDKKVNETSEIINTNTFQRQNSNNDNINLKDSVEEIPEIINLSPTDEKKSRLTIQNVDNHLKKGDNITLTKNNHNVGLVSNDLFLKKNYTEFNFNDTEQKLDSKNKVSIDLLNVKHEAKQYASNLVSKNGSLNDSINSQSNKIQVVAKNEQDNKQSTADLDYDEHCDKAKLDNSGSGPRDSKSHYDVQHDRLKTATNVQEDKVREIAKYLSKFADKQIKRTFHEMRNISNTKTSTNRKQATYSKLSIQGVEKPGGSGNNKYGRNIRKYERKHKEQPTVEKNLNAYQNFETSTHEIDLIKVVSARTFNENELCVCDDFGCLIFYDNESKYEHIHFWNRNRIDCTPEEVFSIFTDDGLGSKINDDYADDGVTIYKKEFTLKDISVSIDRKICWNEIKLNDENNLVANNMEKIILSFNEDAQNISETSKTPCLVREMLPKFPNSNGSPTTSTQIVHNNEMSTANLLQHCQGSIDGKINQKSNRTKNGKKRKCSTFFGESDETPAKKLGVSENKLTLRTESEKSTIEQCVAEEKDPEKISETERTFNASSEVISEVESVKHVGGSNVNAQNDTAPVNDDSIKCGVCGESMQDKNWNNHIESRHDYLAWKHGEPTMDLDDEKAVREHLYNITKKCGVLKCSKCGLTKKYVKAYLNHFKSCNGLCDKIDSSLNVSSDVTSDIESIKHGSGRGSIGTIHVKTEPTHVDDLSIKCAVCGKSMQVMDWNSHIELQHDYLAWKCGELTLDVNDENSVREHLNNIAKELGGLKCSKCGLIRKYVKAYLAHFKNCSEPSESQNENTFNASSKVSEGKVVKRVSRSISNVNAEKVCELVNSKLVKCGVCMESLQEKDWSSHIESRHDYLAWKYGETPLDIYDKNAVREYLYSITKECGGLKCSKCGLTRKYVKAYLTHFKNCNGLSDDSAINDSADVISGVESEQHAGGSISNVNVIPANKRAPVNNELVKCGVCGEYLQDKDWNRHIESRHDYLAWKHGEPPLDIDDEEAVREHLYDITKECGGLKCSKCGLNRKFVKAYLAHFKSCIGPSTVEGRPVSVTKAPKIEVLLNVKQESLTEAELIKCGVCGQYMMPLDWTVHIAEKHDYLAWKEGEPPVDVENYEEVLQHLQNLVKEIGSFICSKCGSTRKYATPYLQHVRRCNGSKHSSADQAKCAVCSEAVEASRWIKHIAEHHEYFAWKEGETPVDVNNEGHVIQHLSDIVKQCGALTCKKCGNRRRVVKSYLEHIKTCGQDDSMTTDFEEINTPELNGSYVDFDSGGTCGVCQKVVEAGKWIQHTQKYHSYLAWRQGEKPWDLDNVADINVYLYEIGKKMDGLTCNKCGLVRKYVKAYLTHIKNCSVTDLNLNTSDPQGIGPVSDKDLYQCAMCKQEIKASHWKDHAMKKHYNITWIIGQTPIDIKNPYAVEKYLKEYRLKYGLKCTKCGATRASYSGFYAHIITCGKTEEEIEMFQSICDICKNKYLCIYKNQHMMIHKVQDYTKEQKMKVSERKEKNQEEVLIVSGKRRAAQKARTVIENYSNDLSQHAHKCESCGFSTDFKEEIKSHRCDKSAAKDFSEDESSEAEMEGSNDESESQVDSDISNEENEAITKKETDRRKKPDKSLVNTKVSRIPFKVENPNSYVLQSDSDFCNSHFTDETLFAQWLSCEREVVSEHDLPKYLPPIEESCKVKAGFNWTTLKRFEAIKGDAVSIFVGACIVSIAWVPPRMESIVSGKHNFLAVACHNGVDCPRYQCDETPHHENLIQIWDFGACRELPKIVYGIAHDFGTVWAIDWCPSGAREKLPEVLADGKTYRLGLLAVACSNGSAYVFSVPYPSTVVNENRFVHKLRPVAELRMTMNSERQLYQATSVTWSKEKGHSIVLVGYADGSTALYDLNCESPLLRTVNNNVEVFFPYHDERPHNTSIIATDMFPGSRCGAGVVCSAGATGADMAAGGSRVRSHLASHAAAFVPHWPGVMLAGDVTIMNTAMNELEWRAPARRLGGVRALAGCARCGRVAAATPPALRLMRPHPAYPECRKTIVAMLEMVRLGNKRKKQVNDELAMVVEPLTYADAVAKYGIEFEAIRKTDKASQQKYAARPRTHCPERFPLGDVKSMAFCPSKRHHDNLAIATHSGLQNICIGAALGLEQTAMTLTKLP